MANLLNIAKNLFNDSLARSRTGYAPTGNTQKVRNKIAQLPQQFQAVGDLINQNNFSTPQLNSKTYKTLKSIVPFQQSGFTQQTVKPYAQAVANNLFTQGIGNVGQGMVQGKPLQAAEGVGRMGLAGLSLYGVGKLNPTNLAVTGGLGAGIGALQGDAKGGFYSGLSRAPSIAGISSLTNPFQSMLAGNAGRLASNPFMARLIQAGLTSATSVPEGYLMNKASGKENYDKMDFAFDVGGGALAGFLQRPFSQADRDQLKQALKGISNQKGKVTLPDPFAKGVDLPPAKPTSKIINNKAVNPTEGIYKNPAKMGSETLIEQAGGWKPGLREKFDLALFNKDSNTVKSLLPDVPADYRAKFAQEIANVTSTPSIKNMLTNEQGFMRIGGDTKVVDQKFDTDKFTVTKKQGDYLTKLQEDLGLDTRNVRSFDEMKNLAQEIGTDPRKLLADIEKGRITDSEVIALGQQIKNSTDRISTLTKQLKADPMNVTIKNQLGSEEDMLSQAVKKRIQGGTEAGRSVAAFRIIANKTLDPIYWIDKAQRQLGKERNLKADEINAINDLIGKKDTLGLANLISGLGESTLREKMVGLWKAGLLTGFRTHEANIISNTGMGALETLKDIPATGFDMARSLITGNPRTKAFAMGEVTTQPKGAIRGLKQAKDYLKTGLDPREIERAELYRKLRFGDTKGGKVAQRFTDTVFGTLGAEDKIFREAAFNRSMVEQAKVAEINGQIDASVAQAIRSNPNGSFDIPIIKQLQERALQDAAHATFTKENAAAQAIAGFRAGGNSGTRIAADVTMPFVKTPTNVAEALFDYSPAGFIKDAIKKVVNAKSVDDRRLAESFGRSTVGSGIVALGYIMAQHGMINGAEAPYNSAANAQDKLEQSPGNSIFIGGQWHKVDRISPIGNLLVLGAEAFKNGGDVTKTTFGALKSLTEQTFLKGLAGGLAAINNPEQSAASYIDSTVSSLVPTLSADIARGLDSTGNKRDVSDGLTSRIMSRIPGLRNELPEKLNSLGDPEPEPNGFLGSLFDPLNSTTPNTDPLVQEFKRVGYDLNYVGDKLGETKLTPDIQREYQKRAGAEVRRLTQQVVESPIYKKLDTDTQRSAIEKAVNKAKDIARDSIKKDIKSGALVNEDSLVKSAGAAERVVSKDAPKGTVELVGTYAKALSVDPQNALKAMFTEEELRKVTGNAAILERQQGLGALDNGDKTTQVDHKIALSLGGSNDQSNLVAIPAHENLAKGMVETYLYKQLKDGVITKTQAQQKDANWKEEIKNMPMEQQAKILAVLNKPSLAEPIKMASESAKTITEIKKAIKLDDAESITNLGGEVIGNGGVLYNNSIIYRDEKDALKTIDLNFDIEAPKTTGNTLLDKKLISSYNGKLTAAQGRVQKLYELGYIDAEKAGVLLDQLTKSKKTTIKGKKAKKAGRISIKFKKAPKLKAIKAAKSSAPKAAKIKSPVSKLKKIKQPKIQAYKVKGFKNSFNSGKVLL